MTTARKEKACKQCKGPFMPRSPLQRVCGIKCAMDYANAHRTAAVKRERAAERKAIREAKAKAKTRAQWMKEAQAAVNAYVRARDAHLPCISCGRMHQGQWHAGHYRSVGSAPHLRFDADRNIWRQCQPCNTHLHGNAIAYRAGLIARIGLEAVEALEADQTARKYTVDDLRQIKAEFAGKLKEIKASERSTT